MKKRLESGLISLGSAVVPHLLAELSAELHKLPPTDANVVNFTDSPQLLRLAWVIDELEATDKLPKGLRRNYFTQRFAFANNESTLQPLFEDAVCRAPQPLFVRGLLFHLPRICRLAKWTESTAVQLGEH